MPEETPQSPQATMEQVLGAMVGLVEHRTQEQAAEAIRNSISKVLEPGERATPPALGPVDRIEGDSEGRATPRAIVRDVVDLNYERYAPPQVKRVMSPLDVEYSARWLRSTLLKNQTPQEVVLLEWQARAEQITKKDAVAPAPVITVIGTSGGSYMPLPIQAMVEIYMIDGSVFAPIVRGAQMPNGDLRWPLSDPASAVMVEEQGSGSGAAGPKPGYLRLTARKMRWEGSVTEEFMNDASVNVTTWFGEAVGMAFGNLEDVQICTSNGTNPNFTANIRLGAAATDIGNTTPLDYTHVIDLFYAVPKSYRRQAGFFGSAKTMTVLSKMVDAGGNPAFRTNRNADRQGLGDETGPTTMGTIFGKPTYEVPLPDEVLLCGPPNQYLLGRVPGSMQLRSSEHKGWDTDEIAFKAIQRLDGSVMWNDQQQTTQIDSTSPFAEAFNWQP